MDEPCFQSCSICVCHALIRSVTFFIFSFWVSTRKFSSPIWVLYNSHLFLHHFYCFLHCFRGNNFVSRRRLVTFHIHKSQAIFKFPCCSSVLNISWLQTSKMLLVELGASVPPICINSRPRSGVKFWIWVRLNVIFFSLFERVIWSRAVMAPRQLQLANIEHFIDYRFLVFY